MENQDGIRGKAPDYIMEKYNRYILSENPEEHKGGLDWENKNKLEIWEATWLKK